MKKRATSETRPTPRLYDVDLETRERLDRDFTYHPPTPSQTARYEELRREAKRFAVIIATHCPPSPERSTAMRYVSEAVFSANAAIARHETG